MADKAQRSMRTFRHDRALDLYELVGGMGLRYGFRRLGACNGRLDWPQRGVYFFVDPAEPGPSAEVPGRVVRVGTHALKTGSKTTLWRRLSQHRGRGNGSGNHRGSVFRKHVGGSFIARDGIALGTWGVGSSATPHVRAVERELEERVSGYLAELLVTFLPVLDEPGPRSMRGYIERNSIGSLSAARDLGSGPSDLWLGWHAPSSSVQESGLWNVRHVGESVDRSFIQTLAELIEPESARLTTSLQTPVTS